MKNILIQITQNGMGHGDESLAQKLLINYFTLLNEQERLPQCIALYNAGVKIIQSDSPLLNILRTIEAKGVKLVACKTCLIHYNLLDKMEVGVAGTMMDIIELQSKAEKVINL